MNIRALAIAAMATLSVPAAAQTAPPEAFVAAVRTCVAAAGPAGVDEARLRADGLQPGLASAQGRAIDTPLRFYGRGDGVIVLVGDPGGRSGRGCMVTGRVADAATQADVADALVAAFGAPAQDRPGQRTWLSRPHVIQFNATGSAEAPAVRIAVVHTAGGTQ